MTEGNVPTVVNHGQHRLACRALARELYGLSDEFENLTIEALRIALAKAYRAAERIEDQAIALEERSEHGEPTPLTKASMSGLGLTWGVEEFIRGPLGSTLVPNEVYEIIAMRKFARRSVGRYIGTTTGGGPSRYLILDCGESYPLEIVESEVVAVRRRESNAKRAASEKLPMAGAWSGV